MMKINTFSKLYLGFNICAMLFVVVLGQAQTNSQEQKTGINRIPITKIDQKKYTGKSVSEIIVLELNLSSSYSFIPSEKINNKGLKQKSNLYQAFIKKGINSIPGYASDTYRDFYIIVKTSKNR